MAEDDAREFRRIAEHVEQLLRNDPNMKREIAVPMRKGADVCRAAAERGGLLPADREPLNRLAATVREMAGERERVFAGVARRAGTAYGGHNLVDELRNIAKQIDNRLRQ